MYIREIAIAAALRAGAVLKENLGGERRLSFKGAVDIVTEMDIRAEDIIVSLIRENFPSHGILTEEGEGKKAASSRCRWIIDPLDGTTNYAHGFPIFNISIAFEEAGEVVLGVVYAPMLDEMFVAEKGKGAFLNNKPISVSRVSTLDKSLLATGFPYDIRTNERNNLAEFSLFAKRAQAIRRAGAAALDLAYVAAGRFDAFWEMRLKPWDVAAAALMVKEAGGVITGFDKSPFTVDTGDVLASNGLVHDEMSSILTKARG
ncbi:MAG: inositol monophosphatase [Deltaproteobacteria bacterium]|nr:inositol monophosphatase [Deltaproteobacteria bacterium]